MCAAKQYAVNQHQQFAVNQCAIKQYVYQYKEWQCVWNQQVAKQDAAGLSVAQLDASSQYVAQQSTQSQHAAEKYSQRHNAANKKASEQYAASQYGALQPPFYHHSEEEDDDHLNHRAVQHFSIAHDVVEQYDGDVCDLNQYTIEQYNEEEYDFNQYAVQEYLVEQFPRNCYAGGETDEDNVINQFVTEQYFLSPYFVEDCPEKDYELNQLQVENLSVHNYTTEPYDASQYVEKHLTTCHQSAEEQYTLNQSASDQYGINQCTHQWYSLNQYEEEQHVMYNYAAEQCEKEEQYQSAARRFAEKQLEAQQFAEGHYPASHYTSQQYILGQGDLLQAAVGQHSANLIAFPHTQQFVAVQYAPNQYVAVDQYLSDLYSAGEQYVLQQSHIDQYPESVYVVDHYVVKQNAGAQYKGDVRAFNQCASGKYVCSQYETQPYVTEHDAAKLQAAVQFEAHAPEQYALNQLEAEHCGLNHYLPEQYVMDNQQNASNQYETEQYALNQFKAEQHDRNHYLAGQYAISHQQNGLNRNPAEQQRMGRKALSLYKTKQSEKNNLRAKRCNLNQCMSEICSTVQCPTKQDATIQSEEKPKATDHDAEEASAGLTAAKHDCEGIEAADLNAAMQEVAQRDSAKSKVTEQDLDDGENKEARLDAPEMAAFSHDIAKSDAKQLEVGAQFVAEHKAATVQYETAQNVQSKLATEHEAVNGSGLNRCKKDCFPSHHTRNQCLPQPKASNHQDAAAQPQAAQLTIYDMARPCATNKQEAECSAGLQSERKEAGVQEPPVDSTEEGQERLEVAHWKVSRESTKPSTPDVAEWDDDRLDATEVPAAELQTHGVTNAAEQDTTVQDPPVQNATQLNTAELRTAGQDARHQTAMRLNVLERDIARQASSGYDLVEPDAAEPDAVLQNSNELCGVQQKTFMSVAAEWEATKQHFTGSSASEQDTQTITDAEQNDPRRGFAVKGPVLQIATETVEVQRRVTEQKGTILDATGHNRTQLDAGDWVATKRGSTVKEHTGPDDGDWDAIGQIVPQRYTTRRAATECEATTQVIAEREPTDHNPCVVQQEHTSHSLRDSNVPMMFPSEQDSAERYRRRGTRSCRTGCSRALFSKGQSSKARYYSRSHYSTRCCND